MNKYYKIYFRPPCDGKYMILKLEDRTFYMIDRPIVNRWVTDKWDCRHFLSKDWRNCNQVKLIMEVSEEEVFLELL